MNDAIDSADSWIADVAVDGEAVADGIDATVAWDAAKSKDWEHLVTVVRGNDIAYVVEG